MRTVSFPLCLSLLTACAPTESPAPVPDARAEAVAMDARSPVPLTPMMAQHQKEMMRGHLEAVSDITTGLATDDWPAIEAAAGLLGSSPQTQTMCEHMGAGVDGFTERALAFHTTADGIGAAARAKDHAGVERALGTTLQGCTSCHSAFRQDVVSDADYAAATGSAPPNHTAKGGSTQQ